MNRIEALILTLIEDRKDQGKTCKYILISTVMYELLHKELDISMVGLTRSPKVYTRYQGLEIKVLDTDPDFLLVA